MGRETPGLFELRVTLLSARALVRRDGRMRNDYNRLTARTTARFFAISDEGVENGSFCKVVYRPAFARGVAHYINGDYVATIDAATLGECEAKCTELKGTGLREYPADAFKALAPKCVGGKGRL